MAEEKRKRILSGIQPTGTPTLGNYIGAVRNWALLQSDYDCLYFHPETGNDGKAAGKICRVGFILREGT